MYIIFQDQNAFNAWHDGVKTQLSIPAKGVNAATGEETADYVTTAYTVISHIHTDGRVAAFTEAEYKPESMSEYAHEDLVAQGFSDAL